MKKILIFLAIIIIIVSVVGVRYYSYKRDYNAIQKENYEYEKYKDSELYGLDIGTLINKATNQNEKNNIEKDENGMYIQNDENSIELEIFIKDNETTYKMETFYKSGTELFIQYYGNIQFKCSKIEYHNKTGKISYMYFEQI